MRLSKTKRKAMIEAQNSARYFPKEIKRKATKFKVVLPEKVKFNPKKNPTTDIKKKMARLANTRYNPFIYLYPFHDEVVYLKKCMARKVVV